MRQDGSWDESRQEVTTTICPYCGVGCNLDLHVQDNRIVKVTSPLDHDVGHGHLCVKGRFGFEFVQRRASESSGVRRSTAALESQGADFPDEGGCQPSWGQR
jgi:predicted molibdopterin-dependent oxidoreductase YjgC